MDNTSLSLNKIDKDIFMSYVEKKQEPISEEDLAKESVPPRNEVDEYYSKAFDKLEGEGKTAYWNWSAAFVPGFWLPYRRMYFYAFLYYLLYDLLISLFSVIFSNTLAEMFLPFVFFGIFGNVIYFRWVRKRMNAGIKPPESNTDSNAVWFLILISIFSIILILFGVFSLDLESLPPITLESLSQMPPIMIAELILITVAPTIYLGWKAYVNKDIRL